MLVSRPSKAVAPTMLNFFTTTGFTMPSPTSVTNIGSRYTITEIMSVIALLSIFPTRRLRLPRRRAHAVDAITAGLREASS